MFFKKDKEAGEQVRVTVCRNELWNIRKIEIDVFYSFPTCTWLAFLG